MSDETKYLWPPALEDSLITGRNSELYDAACKALAEMKSLGLLDTELPSKASPPARPDLGPASADRKPTTVERPTIVGTATLIEDPRQRVADATVNENTAVGEPATVNPPTVGDSAVVEPNAVGRHTTTAPVSYSTVGPASALPSASPPVVTEGGKPKARITESVLKKGDPRVQGIFVGSLSPSMLAMIRAKRKEGEARSKDVEAPMSSAQRETEDK